MEKLFQSIGLSETKARETAKNISVSNPLQYYILQVYTRSFYSYSYSFFGICT
jgi:hypothetical protein